MLLFWILLQQILSGEVLTNSISGTITEDVTFFYRKLPSGSSKVANIKYSISYKNGMFCYNCNTLLFFHSICSDKDYPNMGNCSWMPFDEPFHKIYIDTMPSHIAANQQAGPCKEQNVFGNSEVFCAGDIKVQHYKPCNFAVVIMFQCKSDFLQNKQTLNGLVYNVTIHHQSNTSTCEIIPNKTGTGMCSKFYHYTSFANVAGYTSINEVSNLLDMVYVMKKGEAFRSIDGESGGTDRSLCHQHFEEILCIFLLPRCHKNRQDVMFLCKQMCLDILKGCIKNLVALNKTYSAWSHNAFLKSIETVEDVNWLCAHFPSYNGKDTDPNCFYKPAECTQPPVVSNAKGSSFSSSHTDVNNDGKKMFRQNSTFTYQCSDESHIFDGENTTTCLYSGEWSKPPTCVLKAKSALPVTVVILLFPSAVFVAVWYIWKCMQSPLPRRNKEFDAFVCYQFDESHNFVTNTLKPHLECQFKLLDCGEFTPGRRIAENIENAIKNSNCAIILLSQGFLDSAWCREEFEYCCIESQDDPAFQILVILMQSLESLNNLNDNKAVRIRNFVRNRTCLDKDEESLWMKISSHLISVKSKKEPRSCCLSQENENPTVGEIEMLQV